jgi:hypothetical protein
VFSSNKPGPAAGDWAGKPRLAQLTSAQSLAQAAAAMAVLGLGLRGTAGLWFCCLLLSQLGCCLQVWLTCYVAFSGALQVWPCHAAAAVTSAAGLSWPALGRHWVALPATLVPLLFLVTLNVTWNS